MAYNERGSLGGGFIEFLFTGRNPHMQRQALPRPHYTRPHYPQQARPNPGRSHYQTEPRYPTDSYYRYGRPFEVEERAPAHSGRVLQARRQQPDVGARGRPGGSGYTVPQRTFDPRYERQRVTYMGNEKPGTIVIDTNEKFLYLVEEGGTALRYGVGVGREGFGWTGTERLSAKREWPDWYPPASMRKRQPELPAHMPGGPNNPLGARALYLGDTLYRIHGSNEPWTIGQEVSSGCFRMRNEDVIDLYERVKIGAKVKVI